VIDWGTNGGGPLEYQEWIDFCLELSGQPGVVNGKAVKNNGMCLAANSVIINNEFGSNYASGKTARNRFRARPRLRLSRISKPRSRHREDQQVRRR